MSLRIDKVQLQFEINQDKTLQNIKKAETALNDEKKALKQLKEGTPEYAAQLKKVEAAEGVYQKLASDMKIADMPMQMLVKRQKELNAQLFNMRPGTENYKRYKEELDATKARIVELKGTAANTASSLDKMSTSINKYATSAAAAVIAIVSAVNRANRYVDEYASMEESKAQLQKYTSLTKDEINGMNEDFKKINTRTAREQLNALASDAGKLGVDGKKNLEDFTIAADKINVSLGEELGQDAVKNIGRLAQMFGTDKEMGLSKAMLSTGSAINQLAQTVGSDANYLVDFTARVAGASKQAGLAQSDIIGFASVLNKNMQPVEMAGTAFQTLLLKMYQTPAKFAKMAGEDVKKFSADLKNNANETVLNFLSIMNKQGGLDKLAPMFKDMGLDGVRASGVMSNLASKISDVRIQQKIANDAYKDGTSIDQEFNVQNNTVQAGLEKRKKQLKDMRIELGEELAPVEMNAISLSAKSLSILMSLIKFTNEHKKAIVSLMVIMAAYVVGLKLQAAWTAINQKVDGEYLVLKKLHATWDRICTAATILHSAAVFLFTGKINMAKEAMVRFFAVTKISPWGLLLAGIAAVVAMLIIFKNRTEETTQLVKSASKIHQDTIDKYSEEAAKIKALSLIVHNSNIPYQARLNALNELKKIAPAYQATLTKEGKLINDNKTALDNYLSTFKKKIVFEAAETELKDLYQKRIASSMRLQRVQTIAGIYDEEVKNNSKKKPKDRSLSDWQSIDFFSELSGKYHDEQQLREREIKGYGSAVTYLEKYTGKTASDFYKSKPTTPTEDNNGNGGTLPPKKKKGKKDNPYQDDTKTMEAAKQKELNELKIYAQKNNETENEYNLAAIDINKKYLEQRLELIKKYEAKTKDKGQKAQLLKDEQETQSALIDIDKQKGDAQVKVLEERRDEALKSNEEYYNLQKQELSKQYAEGKLNQYQYDATIAANELKSKDKRLQILQGYGEGVKNEEIKNGQIKKKAVQDAEDAIVQAEIDSATSRAAALQAVKNVIVNFQKETGLTSPENERAERLRVLQDTYEQQKAILIANHQDALQLDKFYNLARLAIEKDYQSALYDIQEKSGIDVTKQRYDIELAFLKSQHDAKLLSDIEYNAKLKALDDDYLNEKLGKWEKTMQSISDISGNVSSAVSGFAEAETIASDAKYDRQIKLAKKAGKDTTKLEEQKEEAQQKIKKKYADMQFASAVLQIGSSTAVAIMNAFASWESVGPWGHALAIAVAASIAASGAAQIAVAKANRDAAKGLYSGGYSGDYSDGGYTPSIDPHDVGGYIPVHGNEFVANHEAVANPHVNRFFRVIDLAQKNGTIRMLDTTAILQQLQLGGKYSGGYTNNQSTDPIVVNQSGGGDFKTLSDKMDKMIELLATMSGKKIVLSLTDVRDGLNDLKTYESNASR